METFLEILALIIKFAALIPEWKTRLAICMAFLLYMGGTALNVPVIVRVAISVIVMVYIYYKRPKHFHLTESRKPAYEAAAAVVWCITVPLPYGTHLFSSRFFTVLPIMTVVFSVIAYRSHTAFWKKDRNILYDYGNRTKEELVQAAFVIASEALKNKELEKSTIWHLEDIVKTAEKYFASGNYTLDDAKELYSRCKFELKFDDILKSFNKYGKKKTDTVSSAVTDGCRYFTGITSRAKLDKKFRELVKKYHPDNGGNTEDFIAMKDEYITLQEKFV